MHFNRINYLAVDLNWPHMLLLVSMRRFSHLYWLVCKLSIDNGILKNESLFAICRAILILIFCMIYNILDCLAISIESFYIFSIWNEEKCVQNDLRLLEKLEFIFGTSWKMLCLATSWTNTSKTKAAIECNLMRFQSILWCNTAHFMSYSIDLNELSPAWVINYSYQL